MAEREPEFPALIMCDRYGRGWVAAVAVDEWHEGMTRLEFLMGFGPWGGDLDAAAFWGAPPPWAAVGSTPDDALAALRAKTDGCV